MAAANQMAFIPLKIVEKILVKLPVESLVRCRRVSKSWRSLISEPGFIRKHLNHASQPANVSSKTLLIRSEGELYPIELSCVPLSAPHQPKRLDPCPFREDHCHFWLIVASCDGLLCLWLGDSVYIWNPCLNNNAYARVFPPPSTGSTDFMYYTGVYLDLGYDSTADDFKLLMLSTTAVSGLTVETRVYSLRSESWTKHEDYPDKYHWPVMSAFVNGSFHWIVFGGNNKPTLLSFDLSKGKYEVMRLPEHDHIPKDYECMEPCVLNGMLGVVVEWVSESKSKSRRHLVLWVMKDYCRREWTKILDISLVNDDDVRGKDIRPFHMEESGEVQLGVFSKLWCTSWRDVIVNDRNRRFEHVESLVSPLPVGDAAAAAKSSDETNFTAAGDHNDGHKFSLLSRDKYMSTA